MLVYGLLTYMTYGLLYWGCYGIGLLSVEEGRSGRSGGDLRKPKDLGQRSEVMRSSYWELWGVSWWLSLVCYDVRS